MTKQPGKFIGFFNLIEAMKQPGCPVCSRLIADTQHAMDSFLYESVNDADIRGTIRRDGGLCHRHSWQLASFGDALGGAIVFNDILHAAMKNLSSPRPPVPSFWRHRTPEAIRQACLFCRMEQKFYEGILAEILHHMEDPELIAAWEGPAVLCLPHLSAICDRLQKEEDRQSLRDNHRKKYERLCEQMLALITKQSCDHRSEEITADEKSSWVRAIEALIGRSGAGER